MGVFPQRIKRIPLHLVIAHLSDDLTAIRASSGQLFDKFEFCRKNLRDVED